jgi:hypothetical protein
MESIPMDSISPLAFRRLGLSSTRVLREFGVVLVGLPICSESFVHDANRDDATSSFLDSAGGVSLAYLFP